MANPMWVDILLLLWVFFVLLLGYLYGYWCASGFKANFGVKRGSKLEKGLITFIVVGILTVIGFVCL